MPADPADEQLLRRGGTTLRLRTIDLDRGALVPYERVCIEAVDAQGRTVGRAAYRRVYGPRAELTLEVDDALWHRGLPEVLLASLCVRALRVGISSFLARLPASDLRLLALLREDFAARESRDGAYVDLEFATARPVPSGWTTEPDARSSPMAAGGAPPTLPAMTSSAAGFAATRVADVMHGPVITCGPETPIGLVAQTMADEHVHAVVVTPLSEAARVMVEHQVNHVLVADAAGRPAGVVSTTDIARHFAASG